jgi:hypothetical protein
MRRGSRTSTFATPGDTLRLRTGLVSGQGADSHNDRAGLSCRAHSFPEFSCLCYKLDALVKPGATRSAILRAPAVRLCNDGAFCFPATRLV